MLAISILKSYVRIKKMNQWHALKFSHMSFNMSFRSRLKIGYEHERI